MVKRFVFFAVLVSFLFVSGTLYAKDDGVEFKMATSAPLAHPTYLALKAFKGYVENLSDGKLRVVLHGASKLADERGAAEGVQLGTIEMACISSAVLGNFAPEVNVLEIPFLFPNRQLGYQVLDSPAGQAVWRSLNNYGFAATGYYGEVGGRDFSNSKKAIVKPEDFKDLRFRVHESKVAMEMYKLLGANPVPLPFPELFTSIQKGVVDGHDMPLTVNFITKLYEVAKYTTDIEFIVTTMPYIANKGWFEKLSKEHQKIIIDGTYHAQMANRRLNLESRETSKKALVEKGCVITSVGDEQRQAFAAKLKPIRDMVPEVYAKNENQKKTMKELLDGIDKAIVKLQGK